MILLATSKDTNQVRGANRLNNDAHETAAREGRCSSFMSAVAFICSGSICSELFNHNAFTLPEISHSFEL